MKTSLSRKQKMTVILMAMTLALLIAAPLGRSLTSGAVRVAAEPRAVAVNWNGFAEIALPGG